MIVPSAAFRSILVHNGAPMRCIDRIRAHFLLRKSFVTLPRTPTHLGVSVTGPVYKSADFDAPTIRLFTKDGCTLCEKVKEVLLELKDEHPHSLVQLDITDEDQTSYWDRYKYDIPVLHINDQYWTKHRLSREDAIKGFEAVKKGTFQSPSGEPNAAKMEN